MKVRSEKEDADNRENAGAPSTIRRSTTGQPNTSSAAGPDKVEVFFCEKLKCEHGHGAIEH